MMATHWRHSGMRKRERERERERGRDEFCKRSIGDFETEGLIQLLSYLIISHPSFGQNVCSLSKFVRSTKLLQQVGKYYHKNILRLQVYATT